MITERIFLGTLLIIVGISGIVLRKWSANFKIKYSFMSRLYPEFSLKYQRFLEKMYLVSGVICLLLGIVVFWKG